ncbi:MAG: hypothetical protein RLZZ628_2125, partial [Bacteroidota bacterium]
MRIHNQIGKNEKLLVDQSKFMKKFTIPNKRQCCLALAVLFVSAIVEASPPEGNSALHKSLFRKPLVAVSISASANPICAGTSVTFTVVTPGGSPTRQWLKNGLPVGTNSNTYTDANLNNLDYIQCNVTYPPAPTTPSNKITMGVDATPSVAITPNPGCTGSPLTATWTNTNESTINWKKNGTSVATEDFGYALNATYPLGTAEANDIVIDQAGNAYVSEYMTHRVTKWTPGAASGVVVAGGNGSGTATNQFNSPRGIAVDANGNVYVADYYNARVMRWAPGATSGVVVADNTTFFGAGQGALSGPNNLFLDKQNYLYISDLGFRVLKILVGTSTGIVVAGGNGNGAAANQLARPRGVCQADNGDLYVADALNHRIQKWAVGASSGVTVAGGNGQGAAANQFNEPIKIVLDILGNLYISDDGNHRVQKWSAGAASGVTIAGGNGSGGNPNQLSYPLGLWIVPNNELYVTNATGKTMKFALETGSASYTPTAAGSYTATVTSKYGCVNTSATVTVNQSVTPTISIATSANPICAGANVTFTATITNGGAAPIYQWKKNGTNVGSNQATYADATLANNDIITCVLTSNDACASPTTATSNAISMSINALQTRIYVKQDATGANDGTTWANAYTQFESALTAGCYASGAEIWVARGTYNIMTALSIPQGVKLYGGFAGTEANLTDRDWTQQISNLYLSDLNATLELTNISINVRLDGFTIGADHHNKTRSKNTISISTSTVPITIQNCIIDNYAQGIFLNAGQLEISDCTFSNGTSKVAVYANNAVLTGKRCQFKGSNTVNTGALGISSVNSDVTVNDCLFFNNITSASAAVLEHVSGGQQTYTNCVITNNLSTLAVVKNDRAHPTFINCTIANNEWLASSGGVVYNQNASPTFTNAILWNNKRSAGGNTNFVNKNTSNPNVTYSVVQNGYAGTGNLNTDPQFTNSADPDGADNIWGTADDGLIIGCLSPALNTGTATGAPTTDYMGTVRPQGAWIDMGAYEQINQPVHPTIQIAIVGDYACIGLSTTFKATITNGGSTPSYQWKKNNVNVGSDQSTYSDATLANNDIIVCQLTSTEPCATPT